MTNDIAALLAAAVEDVHADQDLAGQVLRRHRQHRRRRRLAAAAVAVAAIGTASGAAGLTAGPIRSAPRPAPTAGG